MKRIYFATTNKGKLAEAKSILGIEVVGTPLKIDEVQSLDPIYVAVKKAKSYFDKLQKPLFIEDVSLSIKHLSGLPGPYIDAFMKTLGNGGILKLMNNTGNRDVMAQTTVVYIDATRQKVFKGAVKGLVSDRQKGDGFGWDPIFVPKGETRTFGQMTMEEKNIYSMRAKALKKFKKWLEDND